VGFFLDDARVCDLSGLEAIRSLVERHAATREDLWKGG
jgi:hypothetical protein